MQAPTYSCCGSAALPRRERRSHETSGRKEGRRGCMLLQTLAMRETHCWVVLLSRSTIPRWSYGLHHVAQTKAVQKQEDETEAQQTLAESSQRP
eukprot:26522-Eustigmatos_ZCMA.PRE.1